MKKNFYDKVANQFGQYSSGASYIKEYDQGDPEGTFKQKLIEIAGNEKIALDIGCADGRFTLSVAPFFQKIVAIDNSREMLKVAKKKQQEQKLDTISFEYQDASHLKYTKEYFDVIYNRRGPSFFQEFYRVTKPKGYYLEITIGEQDAKELKLVFGRGQNFENIHTPRLKKNKKELSTVGYKVLYAQDFHYYEYYKSFSDLDIFLQSVPIFEDFDTVKDKPLLTKYVNQFTTDKGITLKRHRIVTLSVK